MTEQVYRKITPIGEYDELKIKVTYFKGEGIYVILTPVKREKLDTGFVSEAMTLLGNRHESGVRLKVKKIMRRSQKQIDEVCKIVTADEVADRIAKLYTASEVGELEAANYIFSLV